MSYLKPVRRSRISGERARRMIRFAMQMRAREKITFHTDFRLIESRRLELRNFQQIPNSDGWLVPCSCRTPRSLIFSTTSDLKLWILVLVIHFVPVRPPDLIPKVILSFDLEISRIGTGYFARCQIRFFQLEDILGDPGSPEIIPTDFPTVLTGGVSNSERLLSLNQIHCGRSENLSTILVERD